MLSLPLHAYVTTGVTLNWIPGERLDEPLCPQHIEYDRTLLGRGYKVVSVE